jgi:hypothetical protein
MPAVKINTSDTDWIERRGTDWPIAYGTDIKGVMYFTAPVEVETVEHVKFAGAAMIRFDLGDDFPADHSRGGMYPESYLVSE